MYTISDQATLECIHQTIGCFTKVSEYICISTTPESFDILALNSSATVSCLARLSKHLFVGPGSPDTKIQVKAKAVEFILGRINCSDIRTCTFKFGNTSVGHEVFEIRLETTRGVSKVYQIPSLNGSSMANAITTASTPFYFVCTVTFLKSVLDHFLISADEVELQFETQSQLTYRAYKDETRASKERANFKKVDTTIHISLSSLQELYVLAPWKGAYRAKEFRLMVGFMEQIKREGNIGARFSDPGSPLTFDFGHPMLNGSFSFTFLTRSKSSDHTQPVEPIIIGNRHLNSVGRPNSNGSVRFNSATWTSNADTRLASREATPTDAVAAQLRQNRRQIDSDMSMDSIPPVQEQPMQLDSEEQILDLMDLADRTEIGMTQGADPAGGLFD